MAHISSKRVGASITPTNQTTNNRQVAVILDIGNEQNNKGLIKGIKKFTQENVNWSFQINEYEAEYTDLSWLSGWNGDGILSLVDSEQLAEYILALQLPVIDLSTHRFLASLPFVITKDYLTAQSAVEHLIGKQITQFAFCGDLKQDRFITLYDHYRMILDSFGYRCQLNDLSEIGKSKIERKLQLTRWITTLPKPTGILISSHSEDLLEACHMAQVSIPEEILIVGFRSNEILYEFLDRQHTVHLLNTIKEGYNAAALLDQMMIKNDKEKILRKHLVNDLDSITKLAKKDKIIMDAVHYIHNNACDGLSVEDILKTVPLSRRMLEYRFRKVIGKTVHDEIMNARLGNVKKLLAETNLTLASIAEQTGFKHTEYLSVVFKREIGISPGQYRKLFSSESAME